MVASPQPMDPMSRIVRVEQGLRTLTSRVPSLQRVPVVLYQRWNSASQTATATGYATAAASNAIAMGNLWEGRIDLVEHPCLSIYGVWGDADSMLPVVMYQLTVGLLTCQWQASGTTTSRHLFDISGLVGEEDIQVYLTVTSAGTAAGSDHILVQPLGVSLRDSPADGVFG